MKILYFAGNRSGADTQLKRFIEKLDNRHQIKIAAYAKSSYSFETIDWLLDPLHINPDHNLLKRRLTLLNVKTFPICNYDVLVNLVSGIERYSPDLIISDGERFGNFIADAMKIRFWSCSPLHILDGIKWIKNQRDFYYTGATYNTKRYFLKNPPQAERRFIYSPWNNFKSYLETHEGYEWITPYHYKVNKNDNIGNLIVINSNRLKELNYIFKCLNKDIYLLSLDDNYNENDYLNKLNNSDNVLTDGNTSVLCDALFNNKKIIVSPSTDDVEQLINASFIKYFDIGPNIGQIEFMDKYAVEDLNKAYETLKEVNCDNYHQQYLHDKIEELAQSISN